MLPRRSVRVSVLYLFVVSLLVLANTSFKSSAQIASKTAPPAEIDVRGKGGVPGGTALRSPTPVQLKALAPLQGEVCAPVQARYNGWTATPYHLLSHGGANNASGLPVYLRFRMTSDFATSCGLNAGWYIDNLVINNMNSLGCPSGLAKLEDNSSYSGSSILAALSRSSEVQAMNPNSPVWAVVGGRSGWEFGGAARRWRPRNEGRSRTAARTELAHSSLFQLSLNRAKVTC